MGIIQKENSTSLNVFEMKIYYDDVKELIQKYSKLPDYRRKEIFNEVMKLFSLEPKRKGRNPTSIGGLYNRISMTSKRVITKRVNKALEITLKNNKLYMESVSKELATKKCIVLSFKKPNNKSKEEKALSDSFVAYETDWCFGVKGYLRHKFNCKDKSRENLERLIQEMEISLKGICSDTINNNIKYRQCDNSRILDIPISQTVTESQKVILQRIQNTCESELLIDLCNDDTIRVENNWKVSLIFRYDHRSGEVVVNGKELDVENYLNGINTYF